MPTLHIPEYLEANIEAAAAQQGRTPQELVEQVLTAHVEAEFPAPETFTEAQIARFRQSITQLDRGNRIPAEQIDEFFADWLQEIDGR
jgi:polyhydroxyalkanoate synthesis regulator protein